MIVLQKTLRPSQSRSSFIDFAENLKEGNIPIKEKLNTGKVTDVSGVSYLLVFVFILNLCYYDPGCFGSRERAGKRPSLNKK